MPQETTLQVKKFQADFLDSVARFPALVAGIGTGKTYMMLLKVWQFCKRYPNSLALVVRKEYTDLKDSTLKDFQTYFNVAANADKEYHFDNGSVVMFRHGAELNVLKNINLSIFAIEQAEEFETEEQFIFLRDRLRRQNAPLRQGCIIANANGHNWIWRMWLNNPSSEEYHLTTAQTFDNADVLPEDFIRDLRAMEKDAPAHYKQYVLNSFDETGAGDMLLQGSDVYGAVKLEFYSQGTVKHILGVDVARFGDCETVFTVLRSKTITQWEQLHQEQWRDKDLMQTVGKIIDLHRQFPLDLCVVDEGGIGGGVIDRLTELRRPVVAFNGGAKAGSPVYFNRRSEGYFSMKDMFLRQHLKLLNDPILHEQLLSLKYKYRSNGQKALWSKDELTKEGLKSPDRADALMMAVAEIPRVLDARRNDSVLLRETVEV